MSINPLSLFTQGPWNRRIGRVGNGQPSSQDEQFCNEDQGLGVLLIQHDGSLEGHANAELASKAPELLTALRKAITKADAWYNEASGHDQAGGLDDARALVGHFS